MSKRSHIIAFTDGAASGNPGPGGWGVVIVTPDDGVVELGGGEGHTTNNRMELMAAIAAVGHPVTASEEVRVYSDSVYVIRGITEWIDGWRKNGWKTAARKEVANRDLWERLLDLVETRTPRSPVVWHHVKGHSGVPGNERVDKIAVSYTEGRTPDLFEGLLTDYGVDILAPVPERRERPAGSGGQGGSGGGGARKRSRGKAYSYLSLVDGVLLRHATWAECEKRVKGRPNTRFRKATSPQEESEIVRSWGRNPAELR